jgi:hypothetical protein
MARSLRAAHSRVREALNSQKGAALQRRRDQEGGSVSQSQRLKVKAHLLKHNSITPGEALSRYKIWRLAPRIRELRKAGFAIRTVMTKGRESKYARYVMG